MDVARIIGVDFDVFEHPTLLCQLDRDLIG